MSDHVLEQRLRPAVEGYSATVALGCAAVAITAPWAWMMSPSLGLVTGALAGAFAAYRGQQAWGVLHYRYGLRNYKLTRIAPHQIPTTPETLYLGHGFKWGQEHTQRKIDASAPEAKRFLKPSRRLVPLMGPARRFEAWVDGLCGLAAPPKWLPLAKGLAGLTARTALWNPVAPRVDLGGSAVLHGVEPDEQPVLMRQNQRTGHMLVMGTTRVGKTRLLELLATQDIHAGHVVIVIDPKGDAELMTRIVAEAHRAGRADELSVFHLGYPDISARYNGIGSFSRITEVAARATNALPSTGNSAAFKEFSWRFTNLVAQAQVALGRVPTYDGLLRDITNIEPLFIQYAQLVLAREQVAGRLRDCSARLAQLTTLVESKKVPVPRSLQDRQPGVTAMFLLVAELKLPDPVLNGLKGAVSYERSFFEKIIASLGPFLGRVVTR
jgi:conjugative coupling factor TraD (TOL family)